MIPYGRQDISEHDIQSVINVLRSDFLTQGPAISKFEESLCDYTGAKYALAVNSCTSALHIACLSLGLGPGDILWTSPITFAASANCALYCGASVDFVDIDPDTALMSVKILSKKLEQAEANGNLPKIVIPVHFSGQSCNMQKINELGKRYGFSIIEDAAHAIGAKYNDEFVGNCRYSDITVFSFHPVKIITTGEGGAALTNNPKLFDDMRLLKSHGITKDPHKMKENPDGSWYYEQIMLGFNYRMTDMQAALGFSQLDRIDKLVEKRKDLVDRYNNELDFKNISFLKQEKWNISSHHLCVVKLNDEKLRNTFFSYLLKNNISPQVHYIPLYKNKFYAKLNYCKDYPNSESYYKSSLSVPLFPSLKREHVSKIAQLINSFFK